MSDRQRFAEATLALKASSCEERRRGVDALLGILDEWIYRGQNSPSLAKEKIQHIVNALAVYAHTDIGCPKNSRLKNTNEWKIAVREGLISGGLSGKLMFSGLFHECAASPVSAALQGLFEHLDHSLYVAHVASFPEENPLYLPLPNVCLSSKKHPECSGNAWVGFTGARLQNISIKDVCLDGVPFFECGLGASTFTGVSARKSVFTESNGKNCTFTGDFTRSDWLGVVFQKSRFRGSFTLSKFDCAYLGQCDFSGSDLLFSCFRNAKVMGANFRGCRIQKDAFEGAYVDENTIFPDGSTIADRGMAEMEKRWPGIRTDWYPDIALRLDVRHGGGRGGFFNDWGNVGENGSQLFTVTPWKDLQLSPPPPTTCCAECTCEKKGADEASRGVVGGGPGSESEPDSGDCAAEADDEAL